MNGRDKETHAFPPPACDGAISDGVIRPSQEECYNNPRAKSTKLRWAILA